MTPKLRSLLALVLTLVVLPAAVRAEDDAEGLADHPTIPRFPGSFIDHGVQRDFEEFDLEVARVGDDVKTRKVEGRYWNLLYLCPEKTGGTEVYRNYLAALQKAGFKVLFDEKAPGGGDFRTLTAEATGKGGGKVWVQLKIQPWNERYSSELWVIEGKAMEQKVEVDATGLLDQLNQSGRVAVYGINFDTGKSTITSDSARALEEIGKLLSGNPELKLKIEGHTDSTGKAAGNLELSKQRAAAVKDWLVTTAKVDSARLTTEGFGDSKPIGDNQTEAGKAQNRRVELVKL